MGESFLQRRAIIKFLGYSENPVVFRDRLIVFANELAICYAVKRLADQMDFDVIVCRDAPAFRRLVRDWFPTAIVLDLEISGLDSLQLVRDLVNFQTDAQIVMYRGRNNETLVAARKIADQGGLQLSSVLDRPLKLVDVSETLTSLKIDLWRRPSVVGNKMIRPKKRHTGR